MEVVFEGKQARIIGSGMDIDATLFCGQAFRYERRGDEAVGVACGRELHLVQTGEEILLMPVNKEEFPLWRRYFDLDRDYEAVSYTHLEIGTLTGDTLKMEVHSEGKAIDPLNYINKRGL